MTSTWTLTVRCRARETRSGRPAARGTTHSRLRFPGRHPAPPPGCSWNSAVAFSWDTNREQAGTQLFYFVNNFHDHLRDAPGSGSAPAPGTSRGRTAVLAQVDDGADGSGGRPDCDHSQQRQHGRAAATEIPPGCRCTSVGRLLGGIRRVRDVNGADDAHIVYHEYTHGLSNRLVTDVDRASARSMALAVGRHGGGVERLVRRGLPGRRAGFQTDTGGARRDPLVHLRERRHSHPTLRLPGRLGPARLPGLSAAPGPAATPTATSRDPRLRRRCMPTARSGSRRYGICARR